MMVHVCKTHKTYYIINKFNNITFISSFPVLLSSWSVNKGFLVPFIFILLGQRRMGFNCVRVLGGGIKRFLFALLGTTSKYVFLHVSLTVPAQNTASLQYADWRNWFSTFIAILDWVLFLISTQIAVSVLTNSVAIWVNYKNGKKWRLVGALGLSKSCLDVI